MCAATEPGKFTQDGIPAGVTVSTYYVTTADNVGLTLTRFCREPSDDPVLIVHGLTTSSDMFIMPEHYNLVTYLLDHEYSDVWCIDNRTSGRFSYNLQQRGFTLDDVALYDYPAALDKMREVLGDPEQQVHVIAHCVGALTFGMSLYSGQAEGIKSVVANSVFLTPKFDWWSRIASTLAPPVVTNILGLQYVDPNWPYEPCNFRGKLLAAVATLFAWLCTTINWVWIAITRGDPGRRDFCRQRSCHMLSLMWGHPHPALFRHRNMDPITHGRLQDLFGAVGMHYHRHILRMVCSHHTAVKFNKRSERHRALPNDYMERAAAVNTPVLLLQGQYNNIFYKSNAECFERLEQVAPGRHAFKIVPNYGHQDIFMGKDVAQDVFPDIVKFLNAHHQNVAPMSKTSGSTQLQASQKLGLTFSETMRGFWQPETAVKPDYDDDFREGKDKGIRLEVTCHVSIDDMDRFVQDPHHTATIVGRVTCDGLGSDMPIAGGVFNVLVSQGRRNERRMVYTLPFVTKDRRAFVIEGHKEVYDDPGFDSWRDTTTCYCAIREGPAPDGHLVGAGIVTIHVADFIKELASFRVIGRDGVINDAKTRARFLRFFIGKLFDTFGRFLY